MDNDRPRTPPAVRAAGLDYSTPSGPAHLRIDGVTAPKGLLVLGHGAGGDIDAADLAAATTAAVASGWTVVRVRQPYRVAGRRAPAPAPVLDAAFASVLETAVSGDGFGAGVVLATTSGSARPVVAGGRSSGARVAARTAGPAGAVGLLALGFPLRPPGRPLVSRSHELAGSGVPALVLQGDRDPFGSGADVRAALATTPALAPVEVVGLDCADHSFRTRKADPVTGAEVLARLRLEVTLWLAHLAR